jgi:hypothetical protein
VPELATFSTRFSAKMDTFAETAIVDFRLSFAYQRKQTFVFHFHLQHTNGSLQFPFPVGRKIKGRRHFPFVLFSIYIYIYIGKTELYVYIYIYCRLKWKTEARVIYLSTFTVCSSWQWKFVVCLFVNKETDGRYPFENRLNGLNGLAHL